MMDFPEYTAREVDFSKPWTIYLFRSGHVGVAMVSEPGTMPVYSCDSKDDALALLSLACPLDRSDSRYYVCEELANHRFSRTAQVSSLGKFKARLDHCQQKIESTLP